MGPIGMSGFEGAPVLLGQVGLLDSHYLITWKKMNAIDLQFETEVACGISAQAAAVETLTEAQVEAAATKLEGADSSIAAKVYSHQTEQN